MADVSAGAVLGALLAGGASSRFGEVKALAAVDGVAIVRRTADALRSHGARVVVIGGGVEVAEAAGAPRLPDREPGSGPLQAIATALDVAAREGRPGALCVACDMPFVAPALAAVMTAVRDAAESVVIPESEGPRGLEPLCAYYPVCVLAEVDAALARGDRAPHRLLSRLAPVRVPLARIRALGDPGRIFFNVNTREDLARAERFVTS